MWIFLQNILPLHFLTRCAGCWAACHKPLGLAFIIRRFVRFYNVNLQEAARKNVQDYDSFNDFFARALEENARPLSQVAGVAPADGKISEFGKIHQGDLIQAKNFLYSLKSLLADSFLTQKMQGGEYITIYLSPKDYHRVHMPFGGKLKNMWHIHGSLYSVNQKTVENIPNLFAKNERLICHFESEQGDFVLVLVGATIVGSIFTKWDGVISPPRPGYIRHWDYSNQNITLQKGEEMGGFLMGSTVILITQKDKIKFTPNIQKNQPIKMGEALAEFL